jgi:hypothetical protein
MDKMFCWALGVFVVLYTVACLFLSLFQCTPIKGYWDPSVEQKCINMRVTLVSIAALNSLSDFLVYLVSLYDLLWNSNSDLYKYPMKPLWSLRLPVKQRLGLIFLFSVGLLVCVVGVLRMYYLEVFFGSYDTHCKLHRSCYGTLNQLTHSRERLRCLALHGAGDGHRHHLRLSLRSQASPRSHLSDTL